MYKNTKTYLYQYESFMQYNRFENVMQYSI